MYRAMTMAAFLFLALISGVSANTIEWQPVYKTFACASDLTIRVTWVGNGAPDFMLGLETDSKLSGQVQVDLATVSPPSRATMSGTVAFQNVLERLWETSPCIISLSSVPQEAKRLALHARFGPNQRVILTVNDQMSINFVVGEGVIVYDGKVLADKGKLYVLKAFGAAYSRSWEKAGPEVARGLSGQYFITSTGFRNHLIESAEVGLASRRAVDCCATTPIHAQALSPQSNAPTLVAFKVRVSPEGDIVSATASNIPSSLFGLTALVRSVKLKPFVADGAPVYAEGLLTFLVEPSGRVSYSY